MTRPITTPPADTARAMHAAEMRGQDMQDAPERIWAWVWDLGGYGQPHGRREWVDFRPKPFHVSRFMPTGKKWWQVFAGKAVDIEQVVTSYTRTDLCITEAECQRRIDAAVLAERDVRTGAEMTDTQALRDLLVKVEADGSAVDHVAIAILKSRFYDCEPEMYDGFESFISYITAADQDWIYDARLEAIAAIRAIIAQATP